MIFLNDINVDFKRGKDRRPRDPRSDKGKKRIALGVGGTLATGALLYGAYRLGGANAAKKVTQTAYKPTTRKVVRKQAQVINQSGKDRFVGRLAKKGAIAFDKLGAPGIEGGNRELYNLYKSDLQDIPDELIGRLVRKTVDNRATVSKATQAATKVNQTIKPKPSFLKPTKENSPILRLLSRKGSQKRRQSR